MFMPAVSTASDACIPEALKEMLREPFHDGSSTRKSKLPDPIEVAPEQVAQAIDRSPAEVESLITGLKNSGIPPRGIRDFLRALIDNASRGCKKAP